MNSQLLEQALRLCQSEQYKNSLKAIQNIEKAIELCPKIAVLIQERAALLPNALINAYTAAERKPINLSKEMARLNSEIEVLLKQHNLPLTQLDPIYSCEVCQDSGYVGYPKKELCECVLKNYRNLLVGKGIALAKEHSFENFDEEIIPDNNLPETNLSQRKYSLNLKKHCENYANSLGKSNKLNLLLHGKSGLGKTYLLNCIHNRALENGIPSISISANSLLNKLRENYFSRENEDVLEFIMDAELLLIDDLGTEPLWENITIEQLFVLFDSRLQANKSTVISTNLSIVELKNRYTERIASRILDKRNSIELEFLGDDIRRPME